MYLLTMFCMDDSTKYNILDDVTQSKTRFLQATQYRVSGNRIENKGGISGYSQSWARMEEELDSTVVSLKQSTR